MLSCRTALALTLVVLVPLPVAAQVYRYADGQGTTHYVDGYEQIPAPYRGSAVSVGLTGTPVTERQPVDSVAVSTPGTTTITYTPGRKIIVDAKINGDTSTRLLLDTGADRTLISPRVLVSAGASLTRGTIAGRLQGVASTTEVQAVEIESLAVGEARVGPMYVVSHDLEQSGIDGLLGRDFLDQFKVTIDAAGGVVTIAPK